VSYILIITYILQNSLIYFYAYFCAFLVVLICIVNFQIFEIKLKYKFRNDGVVSGEAALSFPSIMKFFKTRISTKTDTSHLHEEC